MKVFRPAVVLALLLLGASLAIAAAPAAQERPNDLTLWYAQPAPLEPNWTYPSNPSQQTKGWTEALPVGNGRMGAMVFGGVPEERIQFNEDTLWTGKPHDYVRAGAADHLDEIRKLVFAGKIKEAEKLGKDTFLSDPVRQKAYQPFGDLRFRFAGQDGKPTDYRRELDLDAGVARVSYKIGGVTYRREIFASYPDNCIVIRLTADKPGHQTFKVNMTSPHKDSHTKALSPDVLSLTGQVVDPTAHNEPGLRFESRLKVRPEGGKLQVTGDGISVDGADEVTLLLVAATSYKNFQDVTGDPAALCTGYMDKLSEHSFDDLLARHTADYQALFRGVKLDMGRSELADLPTDERLKRVRTAANPTDSKAKNVPAPASLPPALEKDPSLAALFFQYGRYLLISSSRPESQPANLQGNWNELLNPPWESKYTTNINLEMNYWPAEPTNLSQCAEPLFDLIGDLVISGGRTAREQYHARGWVLHHNTDHWRGTAPINNIDGIWPTGGAWLCYHLWEHYLFTGDKDFLARRAYPAMKGASQFFLDTLVKEPTHGWLVTNPSFSPEQGGMCAGPAMDMQMIRALFDSTVEAANILGTDQDVVSEITAARKQLAPDQVGKHGQLQEWLEDVDQPNNNHRHMSPLWGLFPGAQFTPLTPRLFDSAKVLLKWRGDGSTGWSYAWRIPLWARVHDGEFAYRQLQLQIAKRTLPNLLDLCGPFQIDGNFGATAGIAELLLQSHIRPTDDKNLYQVELLPALPKAWPSGSVEGLCARGGFDVNVAWKDGKPMKITLKSKLGNPARLKVGDKTVDLKTEAGKTYTFDGDLRESR